MEDFRINFTGIGIAKAGTTWLASCLAEHPAVCMAGGKETNYFVLTHISSTLPVQSRYYGTSHNHEGIEWYKARFKHHEPGQLYGEFSNAYIGDPESARLLAEHNPDVKLLCCFRNPIDVMYSGYYQLSRVQPLPDSFEQTMEKYPKFVDYGRYLRNLQPFLDRFPRENLHLMLFDDMRADPHAFYRGACEFLEIDPDFEPPSLTRRVNPRTVLRSRWMRDLRCSLSEFMGKTPARRAIRKRLAAMGFGAAALNTYRALNEKPGKVPPMEPETRKKLVDVFRKDNEALGEFLGRDLSHWNQ